MDYSFSWGVAFGIVVVLGFMAMELLLVKYMTKKKSPASPEVENFLETSARSILAADGRCWKAPLHGECQRCFLDDRCNGLQDDSWYKERARAWLKEHNLEVIGG